MFNKRELLFISPVWITILFFIIVICGKLMDMFVDDPIDLVFGSIALVLLTWFVIAIIYIMYRIETIERIIGDKN